MALRRLKIEQKKLGEELEKGNVAGFRASPKPDNMFLWEAVIEGPDNTPYEGGNYHVEFAFPSDYPFKPPTVTFLTKIWHPGVSEKGELCLDLLTKDWRPVVTLTNILLTLRELLSDPSVDMSLNPEAARQLKDDKNKFEETVEAWKRDYAS